MLPVWGMRFNRLITTTQKGGVIPTIRCTNCFQHLSCYWNKIEKGFVVGVVVCPNCKTENKNIQVDEKYNKDINIAYLK